MVVRKDVLSRLIEHYLSKPLTQDHKTPRIHAYNQFMYTDIAFYCPQRT